MLDPSYIYNEANKSTFLHLVNLNIIEVLSNYQQLFLFMQYRGESNLPVLDFVLTLRFLIIYIITIYHKRINQFLGKFQHKVN